MYANFHQYTLQNFHANYALITIALRISPLAAEQLFGLSLSGHPGHTAQSLCRSFSAAAAGDRI